MRRFSRDRGGEWRGGVVLGEGGVAAEGGDEDALALLEGRGCRPDEAPAGADVDEEEARRGEGEGDVEGEEPREAGVLRDGRGGPEEGVAEAHEAAGPQGPLEEVEQRAVQQQRGAAGVLRARGQRQAQRAGAQQGQGLQRGQRGGGGPQAEDEEVLGARQGVEEGVLRGLGEGGGLAGGGVAPGGGEAPVGEGEGEGGEEGAVVVGGVAGGGVELEVVPVDLILELAAEDVEVELLPFFKEHPN